MLLTIPVNADTATNARNIAIHQAQAMGYSQVRVITVRQAGDVDVGDAGMMLAALRSWSVQVDVARML